MTVYLLLVFISCFELVQPYSQGKWDIPWGVTDVVAILILDIIHSTKYPPSHFRFFFDSLNYNIFAQFQWKEARGHAEYPSDGHFSQVKF